MSFLKNLFGGGRGEKTQAPVKPVKEVEHKGFLVRAEPYMEAGQYQTAGSISKDLGGQTCEHRFVRADRFASLDDAADHAIRKGCQIVDEAGASLFS